VGQDRVNDVDMDRVKVEDMDREVQTDDFPRGRNYNEYMGNNNKALVKNPSECRELGSGRSVHMSRDRNSRVYC